MSSLLEPGALSQFILALAGAVGLSRLLELMITRRKTRGEGAKLEVDAASVISSELRAWTAEANSRASAAEERSNRLSTRIDEITAKLDETESQLDRLRAKILHCQGGPPCPVRSSGTDPRLPIVQS